MENLESLIHCENPAKNLQFENAPSNQNITPRKFDFSKFQKQNKCGPSQIRNQEFEKTMPHCSSVSLCEQSSTKTDQVGSSDSNSFTTEARHVLRDVENTPSNSEPYSSLIPSATDTQSKVCSDVGPVRIRSKRKFPGPAGVLPKLVGKSTTDEIYCSRAFSCFKCSVFSVLK